MSASTDTAGLTSPPAAEVETASTGQPTRARKFAAELPEADAERLVQLRGRVREFGLRQQQLAEEQQRRDRDLAEAWRQREESLREQAAQERRERLSRLRAARRSGCKATSPRQGSTALSLHSGTEGLTDEEHKELLSKYGRRLKPTLATQATQSRSQSLQQSDSLSQSRSFGSHASSRSAGPRHYVPLRKPRVPSVVARTQAAAEDTSSTPSVSLPAPTAPPPSLGRSPRRTVAPAGLPGPDAFTRGPGPGAGGAQTALPPAMGAASPRIATGGEAEICDPGESAQSLYRSLQPKRDRLRETQLELLKRTDVVFYRQHLERRFQRIHEVVKLTFGDPARKKQATMKLSKLLTGTEIGQLAPAGVLQP